MTGELGRVVVASVGLLPATGLGRLPEELGRVHPQDLRQPLLAQGFKPSHAPLDRVQVGPVEPGVDKPLVSTC